MNAAKPTMQDLWLRHPEIQNAAIIEAPGIPYLRVLFVFCGYKVTQEEFDAVLNALNRLTGCHYTQDEIAGDRLRLIQQPLRIIPDVFLYTHHRVPCS